MSALVRLVAGLISLWIGLATAFSLIFLDVKPKSMRFYGECCGYGGCEYAFPESAAEVGYVEDDDGCYCNCGVI